MATFTVKIDTTDSAAFGDETGIEIARILRSVADDVESGIDATTHRLSSPVRDTKGNRVGEYQFKK
jgi:hypothetical protein